MFTDSQPSQATEDNNLADGYGHTHDDNSSFVESALFGDDTFEDLEASLNTETPSTFSLILGANQILLNQQNSSTEFLKGNL